MKTRIHEERIVTEKLDWKMQAALMSGVVGAKEWIDAELKTKGKTYRFSSADSDLLKKTGPVPINVNVCAEGIQLTCDGDDQRSLALIMSPTLLAQIIRAYGGEIARAGESFPSAAQAARALMEAQTYIVNRTRK
jgi:hypothetical protein